jgi:hypothetical protein
MGRHRAEGAPFLTSSDAWLNGTCEIGPGGVE